MERLRRYISRNLIHLEYELPENLYFQVARSQFELEQAFNLADVTKYHLLPSTATLVAVLDGTVVATATLVRKSAFGLPIERDFDLSHYGSLGARIVEVTGLAIQKEFDKRHKNILFPLCKYVYEYAYRYFGADYLVLEVSPPWMDFYAGVMQFSVIPNKDNRPAGVIIASEEYPESLRKIYAGKARHKNLYKYFFGTEFRNFKFPQREFAKISDPVLTPKLMNYFFRQRKNIFASLYRQEVFALHQIYKDERFKSVLPPFGSRPYFQQVRKESRFEVATRGRLRSGKNIPFSVALRSVSRSGVGLFSARPLEENQVYHLEADLGAGRSARLDVQSAWASRFGNEYGLTVLDASSDWKSYIDQLNADMFGEA